MPDALRPIVTAWLNKIELSRRLKKEQFQDDADECMRFYDGPYNWLNRQGLVSGAFDVDELDQRGPSVRMTVNKVAEMVQLYGPALYHRNPVRTATPREVVPPLGLGMSPQDPTHQMVFDQLMQQHQQQLSIDRARAAILEKYLNYTPVALDLKSHSRWAIEEALIKGMGLLWTHKHRPPGATMSWVGSFFDSVDNLQMDPDAEHISDVKWIARRRVRPVWEVEKERGFRPGTLKPHAGLESFTRQSVVSADPDSLYRRRQGQTADLITYWEIYSKMGLGGRMSGLKPETAPLFDSLGDYVYLEIADSVDYPLNIPPPLCDAFRDQELLNQYLPQIQQRVQWETPYWAGNTWPCTWIVFHWRPRKLWPMSHLKPGMGELKFLNWAWSFLAAKVRIATRDFIAIAKAAGDELKNQIIHGSDYTVVQVDSLLGSIDQVVKFLQHPRFNPEIYNVIEAVTHNFERRVGLTELMYGLSARQYRSAVEAQIKSDAINVRPDDMANQVEDAMTEIARKEAFAARWHLRGEDVIRVLGPDGAQAWEQLLVNSDPASILFQIEYRIEANSARKPNKMFEMEKMDVAMQQLFQPLYAYAQATGNVKQINQLISDWAKSKDLDATQYLLDPPPPPPPPPPPSSPTEMPPASAEAYAGAPGMPSGNEVPA